jgi:glycosyltransferase involved in cell wall biosynthesis
MHARRPGTGDGTSSTAAPGTPRADELELSVVVPIFDEKDNIGELYREIREALDGRAFEVLFVDDGSRDGSDVVIRRLEAGDPRVRGVFFETNRGQTAAMLAGLLRARAPLVATMDGDGQNDPGDLPRLIEALGDHDAVVGMRTKRRDSFVRRVSSRLANGIRNALTGDTITDTGCSLKLFRRETLVHLPRFEGLHRFLPTLLRYAGFRVTEVPVNHRPRSKGTSKYGILNRAPRATLDLLAVCWMRRRWVKLSAETRAVEEEPARDAAAHRAEASVQRDSVHAP